MKFKHSKKSLEEIAALSLDNDPDYVAALQSELAAMERRHARYGYYQNNDVPTRNMKKALRMMTWQNTYQDWARLHAADGKVTD